MSWTALTSIDELIALKNSNDTIVLFKHSTRCPVSSMAKRSLEFDFDQLPATAKIYLLDLIAHRDISNAIATEWGIQHESPQVLIIKGDRCLYHASHQDIDMQALLPYLAD